MTDQSKMELFVDGTSFFPVLLSAIEGATKSIEINMFIWRDDEIGNRLAGALLDAMDRGVRVTISKDRYGVVLELAEEDQSSFFHKHPTLSERIKANTLRILYRHGRRIRAKTRNETLYRRFISHENLSLDADRFKADHSKYYVIDGKTLFLGGINVEDKENGVDREGREYQDYMVAIRGEEAVREALASRKEAPHTEREVYLGYNDNERREAFYMEALYLDLIERAERELHLTMAYFSPSKRFTDAILRADGRGVAVHILIPSRANFQSDSNRRAVKRLLKRSTGNIHVYLSPKMVHTKLLRSEKTITLGSTNITKKAFAQLSELNLFLKNQSSPFVLTLIEAMDENYALSTRIDRPGDIRYNPLMAFIEGFLV